jgi:hypothetical protein
MDAVEEGHARPEDEVLGLRGGEPVAPAASTQAGERGAEQRPVHEVRPEAGGPPPLPVAR